MFFHKHAALEPTAIIHPTMAIAPFGRNVTFICTVVGSDLKHLVWEINGTQLSQNFVATFEEQGISVLSENENETAITSVLGVAVTEQNNGREFVCLGLNSQLQTKARSNSAGLITYDVPKPPQNVSATILGSSKLKISWIAPQSLPEVNLTYTVNVTNVNTTEHFSNKELTETFYIFETEESSCDYYTFTVIAMNDAGESNGTKLANVPLPTSM